MTKYLVAYYSWTGNTAKVAKALAAQLSADVEEIREPKRRAGLFAFIRSGFEAVRQQPAAISPSSKDISAYDVVVIGTPVWAGDMASPVRAFISRERPNLKQVALFCTLDGSGAEAALAKMASLCGLRPLAELGVTASQIRQSAWRVPTGDFARRLREIAPAQRPAAA